MGIVSIAGSKVSYVLYSTHPDAATRQEDTLRIGMFADMYKPHLSGVTNYISLYKKRLEELGHEVWVFTFGNTDYVDDERNVVRSPAIPWGDTGWQMGLVLSSAAKRIIPTLDIAHVHHPFLSGRVALEYCKPEGIPIVFTNHTRYDLYSDAYAWFMPKSMRYNYIRRYLREFTSDIDLVIAPSPGIREWLAEFGITDKSVLLSNCIDTEPFKHPFAPHSRQDYGFASDSVVFCYLGRVSAEKNMGLLTEATIKAALQVDSVCLLVLGEGTALGETREAFGEAGLAQRVRFAGLTPYAEVPNHLAACDVFVTASVSEVHPLVVMEAFAAGLPAIGVRSPGVGDIVEDGVTGYLTNEDAAQFGSRMAELALDAELRGRMAEAASAVAGSYDVRIMADKMLAHYQRLIEHRGQRGPGRHSRWLARTGAVGLPALREVLDSARSRISETADE
ncbi:MAG: glycosyltransferase [Coriobacteriia bacterium]|jgi:glycosyltransferase involved in cell wall biosynthesis|nr:glycosyltransferase [Coriobacteriia bacterium]